MTVYEEELMYQKLSRSFYAQTFCNEYVNWKNMYNKRYPKKK